MLPNQRLFSRTLRALPLALLLLFASPALASRQPAPCNVYVEIIDSVLLTPPGPDSELNSCGGPMPSRSPLWPEQFVFPSYTEEARLSRAQSYAIVTAVLDETGQVSEIYLTKGAPYGLDAASLAAVAKWRFEEGTAARRVEVIVHFSFGIEQKSGDDDRPASQTWFTEQDRCRSPQPNA